MQSQSPVGPCGLGLPSGPKTREATGMRSQSPVGPCGLGLPRLPGTTQQRAGSREQASGSSDQPVDIPVDYVPRRRDFKKYQIYSCSEVVGDHVVFLTQNGDCFHRTLQCPAASKSSAVRIRYTCTVCNAGEKFPRRQDVVHFTRLGRRVHGNSTCPALDTAPEVLARRRCPPTPAGAAPAKSRRVGFCLFSRQEELTGFKSWLHRHPPPPPPPTPPPTPPSALRPIHRPHPHSNVCPNPLRPHRSQRFAHPLYVVTTLLLCPHRSSAIVPTWPHLVRVSAIVPTWPPPPPPPSALCPPHCSIAHRLHSSAIVPTWFLCPWFGLYVKYFEVSNVCPNPLRPTALTALTALTAPTALSALSTPLPPLLTAFCPWFGLCKSL